MLFFARLEASKTIHTRITIGFGGTHLHRGNFPRSSLQTRRHDHMNLTFLKQITFTKTRFDFQPSTSKTAPELPPFAGSALRGAFGHAFRKRLCWFAQQQNNPCELSGECSHPAECEYFRLFERSH